MQGEVTYVIRYKGDIVSLVNKIVNLFQRDSSHRVRNINKESSEKYRIDVRWVYEGLTGTYAHDGYFFITELGSNEYRVYAWWEDEYIKEKMKNVLDDLL